MHRINNIEYTHPVNSPGSEYSCKQHLAILLLLLIFVFESCLPASQAQQSSDSNFDKPRSEIDRTAIAIEALQRLKGMDVTQSPSLLAAVKKVLRKVEGTPTFVELVRQFKLSDENPILLKYAIQHPNESSSVEAIRWILQSGDKDLIRSKLSSAGEAQVGALLMVISHVGDKKLIPLIIPQLSKKSDGNRIGKAAVIALANTQSGAEILLKLAEADELPVSLAFTAGEALRNVRWKELRERARSILPAPPARDSILLPPISKLVQRKGNIQNGELVFFKTETVCATCHRINGRGTDFGPDLSEIGAKLAPEALYESILDPNAGVSFGYEAVLVELKSGDEAYGIIISETKDELTLKAVGGIVSSYSKSTIVNREMQQTSIMPIGLQQTMTMDEFVDLIEYLVSLKHAK